MFPLEDAIPSYIFFNYDAKLTSQLGQLATFRQLIFFQNNNMTSLLFIKESAVTFKKKAL